MKKNARARMLSVMKAFENDVCRWLNWRLFFIVVSETFGAKGGSEWGVSHYLFSKPEA